MAAKIGKGLVGRRVRVKGRPGVYRISETSAEWYSCCRETPGRGGRCVEARVPREDLRFVRRKMERLTPEARHIIERQLRELRRTMPTRKVTITIEAPQGWGKGWLARQFAEWISKWKGCGVEICDADGARPEQIGRIGSPIEVKIVTRQSNG